MVLQSVFKDKTGFLVLNVSLVVTIRYTDSYKLEQKKTLIYIKGRVWHRVELNCTNLTSAVKIMSTSGQE